MTRGCIALFCQVLLASAIANEIPCTSEDSSTCTPSEAGLDDDTNILIQRKVDTHEQRIGEKEQSSHGWIVKPSLFSDTMTMTARVKIGGAFQTEGTLTAFGPLVNDDVDSQIRGVMSEPGTSPIPGVGKIYQITMYANADGELLTFRFKDKGRKVTTLKPTETFQVNGNLGSARTPIDLEADGDAWDVNPSLFSDTMTMTAQIKIDGVVQSSGVLAAFSGSQVRGVRYLSGKGPFASVGAFYQITLYGNGGGGTDKLKFKFKDGSGTDTELAEEVEFVVNGNIGDARNPETFTRALPPTPAPVPVPAQAPPAPAPECPDADDAAVKAWSTAKWNYAMGCAEVKQWFLCTDRTGQPAPEVPEYCATTCGFPCPLPTTTPPCADKSAQEVGDWTASMWGAGARFTCADLDSWRMCVAPDLKVKMAEYCAKTCKAC